MITEKLIEIKNVYKIYSQADQKIHALQDVSITINKGEFVAIIGSSGSGKSTLMNIIGCLDLPTKGNYTLNGVDVYSLNDRSLSKIRGREIGFIFQGFNLISGLSALENVELPLTYRGIGKSKRRELSIRALEKVSLDSRMMHRPYELSGGQQQRVAIARALASEPHIILADEPTGNLDSKSGAEVMRILTAMHKSGKTIILITHDENIAKQADRTITIYDGRVSG